MSRTTRPEGWPEADPVVGFSLHASRQVKTRDLVVRFTFGAAISIVASVVSLLAGLRVGGLLLAFPAILPATLTLIEKEESTHKAEDDDVGSILGAIGLAAFAAVAWFLLPREGAPVALVAASGAWLATGLGLYVVVREVALRRD